MSVQELAAALARTESVLRRRPSAGLQDDTPGVARWKGGARIVARHPGGREVETDMPVELGGSGGISPGWMLRASLAACTATCIALLAAKEDIELDLLEVTAGSRSDVRGFFGLRDADGLPVDSGLLAVGIEVRIAALGVPAERLRALVEAGQAMSPMAAVVRTARPIGFSIEVAS